MNASGCAYDVGENNKTGWANPRYDALVEEASAFGSSGIVTAALFGLFTRFGGARAAFAALATGVATWIAGHYLLHLPYPYLASVAMALAAYLLLALTEPRVTVARV